MRASKEQCEKAIQFLNRVKKTLPCNRDLLAAIEFLKVAKAKLPTESSYDADSKRRIERRINEYVRTLNGQEVVLKKFSGNDKEAWEGVTVRGNAKSKGWGWKVFDRENGHLLYSFPPTYPAPSISVMSAPNGLVETQLRLLTLDS